MYVDGRLVARAPAQAGLRIDTTGLSAGPHEVRAVAISGDPIEAQAHWIAAFEVAADQTPPAVPVGEAETIGGAEASVRSS